MSLPYVRINFANGSIGGVEAMDDGCTGLICTAVAVPSTFALDTNYLITSLKELEALGITPESTGPNANVYKCVKEFYETAPKGTKLYLRGAAARVTVENLVDKTNPYAWPLIEYAAGNIRTLLVKVTDATGYTATTTHAIDAKVETAITKAQALAEEATESLMSPVIVILEGRHYTGTAAGLPNLSQLTNNRVCVVIGDTVANSKGAAVGLLGGLIARIPVHRKVSRVKNGAIKATTMYIGSAVAESAQPDAIHDAGFICPRTFVGKGGYYWSGDKLATAASDDYCLIPRRRTIDKAYRVAYIAMLEQVSDEIAVTGDGKIDPTIAKNLETLMESAIINQMTSVGNLGVNPEDDNDTGVVAYVNPDQNIVATSRLGASLRVRPYGYSDYIEVELGFQTTA